MNEFQKVDKLALGKIGYTVWRRFTPLVGLLILIFIL